MPVVPSYTGFAATPNLAEAYLGGQRIAVSREQIAQQAAEASQRASIAREQIAAQQVQHQMQLQAQQQLAQQKMLQTQHQAEVANAYKQIQLGLAERRVAADEARAAITLDEAARGFTQQQAFERARARRKAAGQSDLEAAQGAMLETGTPGQSGFAGVLTPPAPASALPLLSFKMRQLKEAKESILRNYQGAARAAISDEDQKKLEAIDKQISDLEIPSAPAPQTPITPPAGIQPQGPPLPPPPPQIYMGPNVAEPFAVAGAPTETTAPTAATSPGLTIPSSLGATNRVRVLKVTPR